MTASSTVIGFIINRLRRTIFASRRELSVPLANSPASSWIVAPDRAFSSRSFLVSLVLNFRSWPSMRSNDLLIEWYISGVRLSPRRTYPPTYNVISAICPSFSVRSTASTLAVGWLAKMRSSFAALARTCCSKAGVTAMFFPLTTTGRLAVCILTPSWFAFKTLGKEGRAPVPRPGLPAGSGRFLCEPHLQLFDAFACCVFDPRPQVGVETIVLSVVDTSQDHKCCRVQDRVGAQRACQ